MTEFTYQQAVSALRSRVLSEEQLTFLAKTMEKAAVLEIEIDVLKRQKVEILNGVEMAKRTVLAAKDAANSEIEAIKKQLAIDIDIQKNQINAARANDVAELEGKISQLNESCTKAGMILLKVSDDIIAAKEELKLKNQQMLMVADQAQQEERRLSHALSSFTNAMKRE